MTIQPKHFVTPDTTKSYESRSKKQKVIWNDLRDDKDLPKFPDLDQIKGSSSFKGMKLKYKPCLRVDRTCSSGIS